MKIKQLIIINNTLLYPVISLLTLLYYGKKSDQQTRIRTFDDDANSFFVIPSPLGLIIQTTCIMSPKGEARTHKLQASLSIDIHEVF